MIDKEKFMKYLLLGVFWLSTSFGFFAYEFLNHGEITTKVVMACEFVVMFFGLALMRKFTDFAILFSYLIISLVSTIVVNHIPWLVYINGSRDFFGFLFVVPLLRWYLAPGRRNVFKPMIDRQLYYWLVLQAFCITWQFLRYGAGDACGGSMGYGASGYVSFLIYAVSFYLLIQEWDFDNYVSSFKNNWRLILLLYPTFLNETKVSFILFLAYFILLLKFDKRLLIRLAYIIPAGIAGVVLLAYTYVATTGQDADKFTPEYFAQYFYGRDMDLDINVDAALMLQDGDYDIDPSEWWVEDIPRVGKLVLIGPIITTTPGGSWLGAGVGQFKGEKGFEITEFAKENMWVLQGSKPWVFSMFVQMGFLGLIWGLAVLLRNIYIRIGVPGQRMLVSRIHLLLLLDFLLILLYNDLWRIMPFCLIVFYLAMGVRLSANKYVTEGV